MAPSFTSRPQPSPPTSRPQPPLPTSDPLPPLTQDILTSPADRRAALRLVSDSIAQQRQVASRALLHHPVTLLLGALGALAVAGWWRWSPSSSRNSSSLPLLCSSAVMLVLVTVRWATGGYVVRAEQFRWQQWLDEGDVVLGAKYGNDMVGVLVLRIEVGGGGGDGEKEKGEEREKEKEGEKARGVIRAWTTRLRYRRKGLGADLLRQAVRITRDRCGSGAEVVFAKDHANSMMILPDMFNGEFRQRDDDARRALGRAAKEVEGEPGKRGPA